MPVTAQDGIAREPPLGAGYLAAGTAVTGSDGTATVSFQKVRSKPRVIAVAEGNYLVCIDGWVTDPEGNYVGVKLKALALSVSKSTGSAVTGVSKSTDTVLKDVTPSTGTALTSISKSTATVLADVTPSTGSAVTGIPSATGDAHGRYNVDSSGFLHHDHAIGSPTTGTFVTGITKSTRTVLTDVTEGTGSFVTGVSKTTRAVLTDVTTSSGTFLTDVSVGLAPAANVTIHYTVW